MNKFWKVVLAFLGGVNLAFSAVIPIFIALLIIDMALLSSINQQIVLVIGYLSSFYRAISLWIE